MSPKNPPRRSPLRRREGGDKPTFAPFGAPVWDLGVLCHTSDMAHAKTYPLELGARGRLVIPAAVRRRLELSTGSRLVLSVEPDGSLRLTSARARAERLRGLLAEVSPERKLTDELIAERRAEGRAEAAGG